MIHSKYRIVIEKLIDKSKLGEVVWNKITNRNEFKILLKKSIISTDKWIDEQTKQAYVNILVRNHNGEIIWGMVADKLQHPEDYLLISQLHDYARECYYNVGETMDNIITELDIDGQIGEKEDKNYTMSSFDT